MLRIFIGLVIGSILGLSVPQWTGISILGQVFVSSLKAIAPILVALLVMSSVAKAGGGLGPRFRTVVSRYLLSTFIAALLAVVGSFLFPVRLELFEAASGQAPEALQDFFSNFFINMVLNPALSISNGNYIGILFWTIIFGFALKRVASNSTISMINDFAEMVSQVVKWIIQFAPFGILGLVFTTVSQCGLEVFVSYGHLLLLLVGCMLVNTLISNPFISYLMLRENPYPLLFTCLVAFSIIMGCSIVYIGFRYTLPDGFQYKVFAAFLFVTLCALLSYLLLLDVSEKRFLHLYLFRKLRG